MKASQSQHERLLDALKSRKKRGVDPMYAWTVLGIYRLSARIFELKNKGVNIIKVEKIVTNRFGEKVRVANYLLERCHG